MFPGNNAGRSTQQFRPKRCSLDSRHMLLPPRLESVLCPDSQRSPVDTGDIQQTGSRERCSLLGQQHRRKKTRVIITKRRLAKHGQKGAFCQFCHSILITNTIFATDTPTMLRSLRHVNYPVLLDKEAQQSVVLEAVQDTTGFDADRSSCRIIDVGLELEDNSIHSRRALAHVGRRGR